VESPYVARHIKKHTSPQDRVIIFGSEPQILYYAKRLSATRYIIIYSVVGNYRDAPARQEELKKELEEAKPAFAVYIHLPTSWLVSRKSTDFIDGWVRSYLEENYEPDGVFFKDDPSDPLKISSAFGNALKTLPAETISDSYILIFRRKK